VRGPDFIDIVPSLPWYHLLNGEHRHDDHATLDDKRATRAQATE
jgi:hypothetical protein